MLIMINPGDIGTLTSQGALKVIDRKKNIFKLAQGTSLLLKQLTGEVLVCCVKYENMS